MITTIQQMPDCLSACGVAKRGRESAETIERFRFDLWNYKAFPRQHWRRIRTTNGVERINKELKHRTRVVGAFSNEESLLRLAVCLMIDINEKWITGKNLHDIQSCSKDVKQITFAVAYFLIWAAKAV
jgi:transposase-like protein